MNGKNKMILNILVHGFAETAGIIVGMNGIVRMTKKDGNGKRHPVVGAVSTIIGAGITYATYVSSKNTTELLVAEYVDDMFAVPGETDVVRNGCFASSYHHDH